MGTTKEKTLRPLVALVCLVLVAASAHAARFHKDTSDYGNGSLNSEPFGAVPVQNPNGSLPTGVELCSARNGLNSCGAPHDFIYPFQLGNSDAGTITSITLTVTGQSAFQSGPLYGLMLCNPNGVNTVPCSPLGTALTTCADSQNFIVNETGVGTTTYTQTWDFANSHCSAFGAGQILAIYIELCVNNSQDDSNCSNGPDPYIQGPVVVTVNVNRAWQFVPLTPCRLADTRNSNNTVAGFTFQNFAIQGNCGIPSSAQAYALNVTAVPKGPLGYLTVWPAGLQQPPTSTLNSWDGRTKANAVIVPAGGPGAGAVSVYASNTTDVILDVNGYFTTPTQSSLAFYPLTPCRVADTRNADGPLGGPRLFRNIERDIPVLMSGCSIPSGAQAYSLNFTAVTVNHGPLGYLSVYPAGGQQPYVSTLNAPGGLVVPNAAIVPAGDRGDISVFASDDTDLVIDINGYFAAPGQGGLSLYTAGPCRVLDTRNGNGMFSGELTVNVVNSGCGVPNTAQAYVFNSTVLPKGVLGYLSLWADGTSQPYVSTLNSDDGTVMSNMAVVPTSDGSIDTFAFFPTQLILDILGYFAP